MDWPLRFLVLSPTPTWPLDHGNRKRVHQICSSIMDQGHEVHFLYYPSEQDWADRLPRDALAEMERQWTSVQVLPVTRPLHSAPAGSHHELDEWWDEAIAHMLRWLFRVEQFDGLIVNYVWLSKAFEFCPPTVAKILDTHDRFGGRKELLESQGLAPEFFYLTADEEFRGLNRADLVLAIKDQEAAIFAGSCAAETDVVALPYAEPSRLPPVWREPDGDVVFGLLGARNNLNRKSVADLLAVLNRQGQPQGLRILIGGALGDDFLGVATDGIDVMGRVEDIGTFYAACDCVVVPLESSTGQKIRVGEALAFGTPIIAHAHAFEGYPSRDAFHALPSVEGIAAAMVAIARQPVRLQSLHARSIESQQQHLARVDDGIARIIAVARKRRPISLVAVDALRVEQSSGVRLRLRAILRAVAAQGRAVLWVGDSRRLQVAGRGLAAELRALPSNCLTAVYEAGDLRRGAAPERVGSDNAFPTLQSCLESTGATLLWSDLDEVPAAFSGTIVSDPVLGKGWDEGADGSAGTLRLGHPNVGQAVYAPFFLGQPRTIVWREPTETVIWLVAAKSTAAMARIAAALDQMSGCRLRIWCSEGDVGAQLRNLLISLDDLLAAVERPWQVVIVDPRAISNHPMLEVVAQSGAACLSVDPLHDQRIRRSADQVYGELELLFLLELWKQYLLLGQKPPQLGKALEWDSLVPDFWSRIMS